MGAAQQRDTPAGLAYALAAYIWWGAMPLYLWYLIDTYNVPAAEVLGQRIFTGLFFLIAVVLVMRRLPAFKAAIIKPRLRAPLLASTLLVGIQWYVLLWGVGHHGATEGPRGHL